MTRLTPTQHTALRNLQGALYNADWVGTTLDRHDGTAYRVKVDDRDALRFLADALDVALDADEIGMTPIQAAGAEKAVTNVGRAALQDFLDQIHQPGISSGVGMYASKNTGGQAICTTTATALQNLLDDANLAAPAAVADEPEPDRMPAPTAMTTSDQLRHALIDHLDAGTPSEALVTIQPTNHPLDNGLTIPFGTLVDALADAAGDVRLRPTTKSRDTGLATDRDPYAIDLRGPHGTLPAADRATLGGLHDLDPRTRAIFEQLLRITLTNLDRQAPTGTTVIRGGNR